MPLSCSVSPPRALWKLSGGASGDTAFSPTSEQVEHRRIRRRSACDADQGSEWACRAETAHAHTVILSAIRFGWVWRISLKLSFRGHWAANLSRAHKRTLLMRLSESLCPHTHTAEAGWTTCTENVQPKTQLFSTSGCIAAFISLIWSLTRPWLTWIKTPPSHSDGGWGGRGVKVLSKHAQWTVALYRRAGNPICAGGTSAT